VRIHRDKRGKFRCGETVAYKMTSHFGQFNRDHEEAYKEAALEKYDFGTCQRPDGSFYGSPGRCIKGSDATKPENSGSKKDSKGGGGGSASGGGGGSDAKAEAKGQKQLNKEVKNGGAEGIITKGGARTNPNEVMKKVSDQLEKEYPGLKMSRNEANGERVAAGYVDGFVTSKNGSSYSVSTVHEKGMGWVIEDISSL